LEAERTRIREDAARAHSHQQELERELRDARARAERDREKAELERARGRAAVNEMIENLRREGSELMRELKQRSKSRTDLGKFVTEAAARLETVAPPPESDRPAPDHEPLRPGDQVELGEIRAELMSIDTERAVIVRGGLKIEVSPERLRRAREKAVQPYEAVRKEPRHAVTFTTDAGEHAELNLIGMRSGDALRKLEEFLDQAFLTNRAEVRIVHGIGSGALRKAIQEYLGTSPYCASFTPADPHHGGAGATIVQMNL
ncbi:MAG: Smr/MutS family protein, partial [Candidatus Binataceae bacterium]